MGKRIEFCNKVSRMLGHSLELVEESPDYFGVKLTNEWLRPDQSIYLSNEFVEWVSNYCFRYFDKRVKWDNLMLNFWFEDEQQTAP
tara:strand:- start:37 stop:294 length:258 start_codon:yes stop_codon:yes gene_type:complete